MCEAGGGAALRARRAATISGIDLAVLAIAFVWGASYPVAKEALVYAPVLILIFYRFLVTAGVMLFIARKEIVATKRTDWTRASILGAILFAIFLAETYGVSRTTATNTALIISLCVVFTPLLDYGLARRLPPVATLAATATSCLGVAVLTGGMSAFTSGDFLVLAAAVLRAIMVVTTKRLMAGRNMSSAALTAIQALTVALLTFVLLLTQGDAGTLLVDADLKFWLAIGFLSLFCTIAAFYVQNAAVRAGSPTRVGLLMGTEPLFGFLLAHGLLAEPVTLTSLVGASLIVGGTLAGILFENRKQQ